MEDWISNLSTVTINGSSVTGFHPVYYHNGRSVSGTGTGSSSAGSSPLLRKFNFDPHLSVLANQPVGSPRLPITAINQWSE